MPRPPDSVVELKRFETYVHPDIPEKGILRLVHGKGILLLSLKPRAFRALAHGLLQTAERLEKRTN